MKETIQNLRRAVEAIGGTLDKTEGFRDMADYVISAPEGFVWEASGSNGLVLRWAMNIPGDTAAARQNTAAFNADELKDAFERIAHGMREMNDEERYEAGID